MLGRPTSGDRIERRAAGPCTSNASPSSVECTFTGRTSAFLAFRAWANTENSWDGYILQVSTDGGATWQQVMDVTPDYENDVDGNNVRAWSGDRISSGYRSMGADLSAWVGGPIQIRFAFYSDGSNTREGVYIDDVVVYQ